MSSAKDLYTTIPSLPKAGQEIDALELAARMAEATPIPEPLAQEISRDLDALDGKADGLVAVDKYSDDREARINTVIRSALASHGISHTHTFLSLSYFTNVLLNDTRDPAGLLNSEQLENQIAVNLDKLGFVYDPALPQALAEMVQNEEGHRDGLISIRRGESGTGRGNTTLGQMEALIQSAAPDLPAAAIAAVLASALNPRSDFVPPQNIPPAPGREGESFRRNEEAIAFLFRKSSGWGATRASVVDPSLFYIPEFVGINQELRTLVSTMGDPTLLNRLQTVYLSTGDASSKIKYVLLSRLRLSSELEQEIRGIGGWLMSTRMALNTQGNKLTPTEETELRRIVERLSQLRPQLMNAVQRYRSSFPPQNGAAVAQAISSVSQTPVVQSLTRTSQGPGPAKFLMIGALVLVAAGATWYLLSSDN